MNQILSSIEEMLTALHGEMERTPTTNKARCKKLESIIKRMNRIHLEAYDMYRADGCHIK